MMPELPPRLWAEIDAGALAHNVALLRERFGPARIMAVVKANAYGHDAALIAPLCAALGLADFGVATPAEGIALRGLVPPEASVYLLGPAFPGEAPAIVRHRLIPLLSSLDTAQALSEAAQSFGAVADVHLDVDTGIGRAGAQITDAPAFLSRLDRLPGLRVSGVATHFADADDNPADAARQHALFTEFLETLGERADTLLVHAANSPGALNLPPRVRHGLIRPGLLLYGIEPTPGDFGQTPLRPVLSLKTRVTLCRPLPGGATISYGAHLHRPARRRRLCHAGRGLRRRLPAPLFQLRSCSPAGSARADLRACLHGSDCRGCQRRPRRPGGRRGDAARHGRGGNAVGGRFSPAAWHHAP